MKNRKPLSRKPLSHRAFSHEDGAGLVLSADGRWRNDLAGGFAQRIQDGVERPLAHLDPPPVPVQVARGYPVGRGPPSGLVARHPSMIGPSGCAAHNPYGPSYLLVC